MTSNDSNDLFEWYDVIWIAIIWHSRAYWLFFSFLGGIQILFTYEEDEGFEEGSRVVFCSG